MDGSVMKNIGNGLGNHKKIKKLVALFVIKASTYLQWEAVHLTRTLQEKKHQQLMLERSKSGVIDLMFNKPCSSCTKETEDSKKSGSLDALLLKNEVINVEILWCLKLVAGHLSYNSCSNVSEIFKIMFRRSDVACQFSPGKTKARYMILNGIAPYCKAELLGQINSSPQFSLSFDESLNTALQKCQMDAKIRLFNNTTNMVVTQLDI